ncbi:hypothetical protein GGS24DRAFT_476675 [Hypoxylon argillaceum]|nr:hypothetical protein GGS24DRAFT_476675 [Hypoxylon argillaceum]
MSTELSPSIMVISLLVRTFLFSWLLFNIRQASNCTIGLVFLTRDFRSFRANQPLHYYVYYRTRTWQARDKELGSKLHCNYIGK